MNLTIDKIYLSTGAKEKDEICVTDEGETGVVVVLSGGEKYYASFLSFDYLEKMHQQHLKEGDFLQGSYFWMKNLVLVKDSGLPAIKRVVEHLVEDGDFKDAFLKL